MGVALWLGIDNAVAMSIGGVHRFRRFAESGSEQP